MSEKNKGNESKRWLDHSTNVRLLIRGLYVLCILVFLIDIIFSLGWHKHAAFAEDLSLHSIETLPAFYGIYGFVVCVGLVFVSKWLRAWKGVKILMREEDYWDK